MGSGPEAAPWNSPRALELVEAARTARQVVPSDSALRSYRADARGFVYFFLERPLSDERTLVKADQVALEVYWRAPDRTRQRIVGLRDEKVLPTNIRYHLDHLTVVQDDFRDRIRMGDGDEVEDVLHPMAPGSERVYDFLLADSLTLAHSGGREVRVYELRVRPRDMEAPGLLGSVFVDRATAAIVRMRFTFTPASYVDPYLDYIRVSLENGLWMERWWLPRRQEVELRRELPRLDFLAGSVIRSRFEVGSYAFNPDLPDGLFRGSGVTALPEPVRRAFPFEEPLYADLDEEGLAPAPSLEAVRDQARELARDRALTGLAPLRLHLPSASSAYRYTRAEGHVVGVGTTLRSGSSTTWRVHGSWAFGRERPSVEIDVLPRGPDAAGPRLRGWVDGVRDVGPVPGASGVVNSLAALAVEEDYTDPWYATGLRLHLPGPRIEALGSVSTALELGWERHEAASPAVEEPGFRPVRPVEEGNQAVAGLSLRWGGGPDPAEGWGLEIRPSLRLFDDRALPGAHLAAGWTRGGAWADLDVQARLRAGLVPTDAPPQHLHLLGGRETLLGFPYRSLVGDAFWLAETRASWAVLDPWISIRLLAAAGQARARRATLPEGWADLDGDAGVRVSLGAGLGLLWEVLQVDVARGLDGGTWSVAFSVAPRFRPWL